MLLLQTLLFSTRVSSVFKAANPNFVAVASKREGKQNRKSENESQRQTKFVIAKEESNASASESVTVVYRLKLQDCDCQSSQGICRSGDHCHEQCYNDKIRIGRVCLQRNSGHSERLRQEAGHK